MKPLVERLVGAIFSVALIGCGGAARLAVPVPLEQDRVGAEASLTKQKFCRHETREQRIQSYVRCHSKGLEIGESWIVVDYDKADRVAKVQRMELYPTHEEATKRWNALVEERAKERGAESEQARAAMATLGEAPMGAVVWKVWRVSGSNQLDAIYLVKPTSKGAPNVVEIVRRSATP